jgi:hypothetical protein
MEAIFSCCAGLDVHKKTVVACVRRLASDGRVDQQVRTFGTMTDELLELADWLAGQGVSRSPWGLDHRLSHRSGNQAAERFRVERGAAGRAGTSSRSRTSSNRSWGLAPKKRSAAVVPSGRRIR